MYRADWARRAGFSYRGLLVASLLVAAPTIAWLTSRDMAWSSSEDGPLMHTVALGTFVHEISERGSVESASNVEVRCEVQSRGRAGTTILWVIPEGTYVQPGDELVRLDASALDSELTQQQIVYNQSKAAVTKADLDLQSAKLAKEEYLQGQYELDHNTIEREIFNAEEAKRQAQQALTFSQALERKGYVTHLRVATDQIAVERAELDVQSAKLKIQVLDAYTKKKMLNQLDSAIATCEAQLASQRATHALDVKERDLIQSQIDKCVIRAPEAGQVVYANETNRHGGNEIIIEEGTVLREHQVIVRLPDPRRMQVVANINEAKIALVKTGLPVAIRMDAFSDMVLSGVVDKVNEYPAPSGWFTGDVKEYETTVRILNPPPALRPGLTAEVRIVVERLENVLQVPVQTVFEHGKRQYYCIVREGKDLVARKVTVGSTNDKFVIIKEGLSPGEEVVMAAFAYRDKVGLPDVASKGKDRDEAPAGESETSESETEDAAASSDGPPRGPEAPVPGGGPPGKNGPRPQGGPPGKGGPPSQGVVPSRGGPPPGNGAPRPEGAPRPGGGARPEGGPRPKAATAGVSGGGSSHGGRS
ncbi:MAG: HlyD family efflux transporter periplasmic adaptor subunit [Pirellulales bacterium]|nr:HlyD family efflux transporter periplasmic adaptor subunit [Pirellulales bacterium]